MYINMFMIYLKMFKYPVRNNYVCISYPFIYSNSELFWHVAVYYTQILLLQVVLQNRFSEGGAKQLEFDMTRNLFPLFGEYTTKPQNYFRL